MRGVTGRIPRATDDILAQEGSFWSGPGAVVVPDSAHFEYDLGSVRPVKALLIQADNNDQYVVEGSTDGQSYRVLWTAPPTFVGFGLRTRWVRLRQPAEARFLRVHGRGGDGYYSISEMQAYCKVPAVFPPKLKQPPRKYGWDNITNDSMVNIKGVVATFASVLLLLGLWRRFHELRVQALSARGLLLVPFALVGCAALWLGGLVDANTAPASLASLARGSGQPLPFYLGAAFAGFGALAVVGLSIQRPRLPRVSAFVVIALTLTAAVLLALAAIAGQNLYFAELTKQVRSHASAPGLYYTAGMMLATGVVLAFLCLQKQGPRLFDSGLAIVGLFCFFAWWNLGHYHFDHYVHIWEHYHYIVGAKYPELRYKRLYQCTAVADVQDGLKARVAARKMRRIESDNRLGTSDEIIVHPELCTSMFKDPQRWEQFRADIRFFRQHFSQERWDESQNDHGYNATPVWAIAGRFLTERVQLTWDNIINLGRIDSAYLIAMWLTVLWAFGWRPAAVAAVYWGCNFPARFYWNGGSFLRYDWLLWLIVGICLLRKRRHFFAGAALTYSTLLRVFPGFVVAALVLKAVAGMVRERRIFLTPLQQRFAVGCLATFALLMPVSAWATNGLDAWPEFAVNSKKHLATALTNNMGLKTLMGYDFDTRAVKMRNTAKEDPFQDWKDAKEYFYHKRAPLYLTLIALFCVLLARAGDREEDDWVAACLGAGLIVMAAELTCYYYGFLMTYGLLWERRKLPGILTTILAAFTCFIYDFVAWNDDHFAAMSLATVLVVVAVTAQSAFGERVSVPEGARVDADEPKPHTPGPDSSTSLPSAVTEPNT